MYIALQETRPIVISGGLGTFTRYHIYLELFMVQVRLREKIVQEIACSAMLLIFKSGSSQRLESKV